MDQKIGIFSFFAGAGFLDLGFESTGKFETVFVNEYHKPFMEIYQGARKNLDVQPPRYGYQQADITENLTNLRTKWLADRIQLARKEYPLFGFIGGPPCPDFSVGGKNRGKEGENGRLSGTYIDLICNNHPDFFLFENVKGLYRTKKHRAFFDSLKAKLADAGYLLTEKLINSVEYGAPQDRERIILIGIHQQVLSLSQRQSNDSHLLPNFPWSSYTTYSPEEVFSKPWPGMTEFEANSQLAPIPEIIQELTVEFWFQKNQVTTHLNATHHFTP
ncbi:MAG: DNA cytosine methyltransferase, partial [Bacteroidota bacterium]